MTRFSSKTGFQEKGYQMKILFFIITSIFLAWSIAVQGNKKLAALMCALLCFDGYITFITNAPFFHSARSAIITGLLFNMLYQMKKTLFIWHIFPFKWQMLLMLSVSFIIAIFSENIPDYWHTFSIPVMDFLLSYFILYIFYCFSTEDTFHALIPVITGCAILLTFIGAINLLMEDNPYIDQLVGTFNVPKINVTKCAETSRFRVNSLFINAFNYGYICCVLNVLAIYLKRQIHIGSATFHTLFLCSLFGIVFCNCRTVFFSYILGITVYFWTTGALGKHVPHVLLCLLIAAAAYTYIPPVQEKTDMYLSMFTDTKGEKVKGSSLKLRQTQLKGTLIHFYKSPIVGHGYGYLTEIYRLNKERSIMARNESVVFLLLAERGIIGVAAYLFFYGSIFLYFYRHRKNFNIHSAVGLALLTMYGFYSIATGELNSVPITLACIGIIVKNIDLSKFRIRINKLSQTVDIQKVL